MKEESQHKVETFTKWGAWVGFVAYLVVVLIVVLTFV